MRTYLVLTLVTLGIVGCGTKPMTPTESEEEQKAISSLVTAFWQSYGTQNWDSMNKLFTASGEFYCYGTDSVRTVKAPWQPSGYESALTQAIPGDISSIRIHFLDAGGELASVLCQVRVDMIAGGQVTPSVARFAAVTMKVKGEWRILHCMASFPVCPPVVSTQASLKVK